MKYDLILRHIGSLYLIVCPQKPYGENIIAVNQSAAEIFELWKQGLTASSIVENLKQRFILPEDFNKQVILFTEEFEKLSCGDTPTYIVSQINSTSEIGADQSFWENRVPVYGGIEPTWRCNLKCCHCYIRDDKKESITLDAWKTILDQLVEVGCLHLAITGGEPLFYKDFKELYRYAALSGFLVTVFTNATLIDEDIASLFNELPPRRLEISIYGATESSYEAVTRVKGSFSRFMKALNLLNQYRDRVPVILKSVLLQENVGERFDVQRIAVEMNLPLAQNSLIRPRLDGNEGPELHRLIPSDVAKTEFEIKKEFEAWDEFAVSSTPISRPSEIVDCSAGNVAFQIDPLGRLGYCVITRAPGIDLLRTTMKEAWEQLGVQRALFFRKPDKCLTCEDSKFCDYCPGYLSIGNKSTTSSSGDYQYHCAVAKKRHKKYLEQNPERRDT